MLLDRDWHDSGVELLYGWLSRRSIGLPLFGILNHLLPEKGVTILRHQMYCILYVSYAQHRWPTITTIVLI